MTGFQFIKYLEEKGICYKREIKDKFFCLNGETRFVYVYKVPYEVYNIIEEECGQLCDEKVKVSFDFFLGKETKIWFICRNDLIDIMKENIKFSYFTSGNEYTDGTNTIAIEGFTNNASRVIFRLCINGEWQKPTYCFRIEKDTKGNECIYLLDGSMISASAAV